jgi:hypothetical protein
MRFLLISSCSILLCTFFALSCSRQNATTLRTEGHRINLSQNVTNDSRPKDAIFVDFEKNWRKFISQSPEIALPVVAVRDKTSWRPIVQEDCVFSPDAGGNVPQVSLTWTELAAPAPAPAPQTHPQQQQSVAPAAVRFDLALHYKGFERNYYSTALSTEKLQRFNLPSNSELIANSDQLLVSGPSLFPKLMDFHTEMVKARDTNREIPRQTLVVRDLAPGLAYTLRRATLGNKLWNADGEFSFSTPVCPQEF